MTFQKGKSGNENGRSKMDVEALRALRIQCRQHAEEVVAALLKVVRKPDSQQALVSACKELLDRGYGKAAQQISGDPENPVITIMRVNTGVPRD